MRHEECFSLRRGKGRRKKGRRGEKRREEKRRGEKRREEKRRGEERRGIDYLKLQGTIGVDEQINVFVVFSVG